MMRMSDITNDGIFWSGGFDGFIEQGECVVAGGGR